MDPVIKDILLVATGLFLGGGGALLAGAGRPPRRDWRTGWSGTRLAREREVEPTEQGPFPDEPTPSAPPASWPSAHALRPLGRGRPTVGGFRAPPGSGEAA